MKGRMETRKGNKQVRKRKQEGHRKELNEGMEGQRRLEWTKQRLKERKEGHKADIEVGKG